VADALGGLGETAERGGDGAGKEDRQEDGDAGRDKEHADDRHALGVDDVVDVAALGRQQKRAALLPHEKTVLSGRSRPGAVIRVRLLSHRELSSNQP